MYQLGEKAALVMYMYQLLFHTCIGASHEMLIFGDTLINMKIENR